MIYRFFVALTFTIVVFPFAAMYTFAAVYPDAHFAFDSQTWLQGLAPIAFGWVVFLLPGLLPFVGHRYYDWVAKKTGFTALFEAIGSGLRKTRDGARWLNLKTRTVVANRPNPKELISGARAQLQRAVANRGRNNRDPKPVESQPTEPGIDDSQPSSSVLLQQPEKNDEVATTVVSAKAKATESLDKARAAIKDAPKHVAKVRQTIDTLRHRLIPDDMQRTIDLNQYTLEALSHIKRIMAELLLSAELGEADRAFCDQVVSAIPEPPSPSEAEKPLPSFPLVYPEEHRDTLKHHAANAKVILRDLDFEEAAAGNLERALHVLKAIVAHETRERASLADAGREDLMVGLPAQSSA